MHLMTGKLNLNNVIRAVIDRPCICGCHPSKAALIFVVTIPLLSVVVFSVMLVSIPLVNFVDSSPLWEPYGKPLLKERWYEVTEWWLFRDVPYSHYPL